MNLGALTTETTVSFDESLTEDEVIIGDTAAIETARARVVEHLDRIRNLAEITAKARVKSQNNFPAGTGLASSASAFAALTVAGTHAAGLDINERALTVLARQGSGSAARSIPGGFVEWLAASYSPTASDHSFAHTIMPAEDWDLCDVVVIVSRDPKKVGSSEGHAAAVTSPFFSDRLKRLPERFHRVKRELLAHNLKGIGPDLEAEAVELSVMAMTSRPPIFYWSPTTVRVLDAVRAWRAEGLSVYFTLDAGPNVHLICEAKDSGSVAKQAQGLEGVTEVIASGVGTGAKLSDVHLF